MTSPIVVEVSVDSVASAIAAESGGAARVELCSCLSEGGITPSTGLIESVRAAISMPIHVMIRPRAGDFCYDADEFAVMQRDIAHVRQMPVQGVVFGTLDANGDVDLVRARQLVEESRPLHVTFHRAFDMSRDLSRALDDICTAGCNRVLTSGGEATSIKGRDEIAKLVKQAAGRIVVMAGSGIKPENARALVEHTGVGEIHAGLRSPLPSPMLHRNARVTMGSLPGREYERVVVLEESVRALCSALKKKG